MDEVLVTRAAMIIASVTKCCTMSLGAILVMNLTLKPDDERFLNEQVKAGRFSSPEDAVAEAIDRLRWGDDVRPTQEDLAAVREGLAQLDRGEGIPWETVRRELNAKHGLDD
jgi:Arc/MetJ-type ribon-helix-helix transcriptional regulator